MMADRIKVVVNKFPKTSKECPFAIHCDLPGWNAVCGLRRNSEHREISFGSRKEFCQLDAQGVCTELVVIY